MRAPAQHPSMKRIEGPALDLAASERPGNPAKRARAAAPGPADSRAPSAPTAESFGSEVGALADWDGDDLEISLDVGDSMPPLKQDRSAPRPAVSHSPANISRAPQVVGDEDAVAVAALAGYGDAPGSILGAPAYAWGVYRRRKELVTRHAEQKAAHHTTMLTLREKVSDIVDAIAAAAAEAFDAGLMAPVRQSETLIDQRRSEIAASSGLRAEEIAAFDSERASLEERRRGGAAKAAAAGRALEQARADRDAAKQACARLKRALEAAHEEAAAAAGSSAYATPEHARKISGIDKRMNAASAAVAAADSAVSSAKAAVKAERGRIKEIERGLSQLRKNEERSLASAGQAHAAAKGRLDEAHIMRLDAYDQVLEVLDERHSELIDEAARHEIAEARAALSEADAELERHRLAVDAFDAARYKQGIGLVVAVALALLLLLLSLVRVG